MSEPRFEVYPRKTPPENTPLDQTAAPLDWEGRPGPQAEYGWRFRAANGQITAIGEGFSRREDAHRAVNDFMVNIAGLLIPGKLRGNKFVPDRPVMIHDVDE